MHDQLDKNISLNLNNLKKIMILGSPGSGKTYFTKRLASLCDIPAVHIDDYYWEKNWCRLEATLWHQELTKLCEKPSWIMDGNHAKTLELRLVYADCVVLLDFSVFSCLYNYTVRSIRRYFGVNDHLPARIAEDKYYKPKLKISYRMIKLILCFKFATRRAMLAKINASGVHIIKIRTRKKLSKLIHLLMR